VAIRRNPGFDVFNVRLLINLDKLLREKRRYQGDLSASINDALLAVNLNRPTDYSPGQEEANRKGDTGGPFASAHRQTSSSGEAARLLGQSVGEQRVGDLLLEGTDEEARNCL